MADDQTLIYFLLSSLLCMFVNLWNHKERRDWAWFEVEVFAWSGRREKLQLESYLHAKYLQQASQARPGWTNKCCHVVGLLRAPLLCPGTGWKCSVLIFSRLHHHHHHQHTVVTRLRHPRKFLIYWYFTGTTIIISAQYLVMTNDNSLCLHLANFRK